MAKTRPEVAAELAKTIADRVHVSVWRNLTDLIAEDGALDALAAERVAMLHDEVARLHADNVRLQVQNRDLRILATQHMEPSKVERDDFQKVVFAVLDDPGYVKIGCAQNPSARYERKLGLRVLFTEPGGATREREHHRRFADYRVRVSDLPEWVPEDGRTEWFRVEGELGDYLALREAVSAVPHLMSHRYRSQ